MTVKQEYLRKLPKVDVLLGYEKVQKFCEEYGREVVVDAIREELDELRLQILRTFENVQDNERTAENESGDESDKGLDKRSDKGTKQVSDIELNRIQHTLDHFTEHLEKRLQNMEVYSLRKVLNATGIILHTNLGRAPLGKVHLDAMTQAMCGYSNLEFDLEKGQRGKRWTHYADLIAKVTGAEGAIAVNNNAASLTLIFGALTKGKEVIVSRGEAIEIGGKFRIPEVIEQSGAILREVGTTNRTRISDYEKAITEETGALLKVHTSNYKVVGFTEEASLEELAALGKKYNLPVIMDLGSGVLVNLETYGLAHEPTVQEMLKKGADLVCFSGDKLLGGPQAGIITGKKSLIEELEHYPLMRAIRLDKCLIAALEVTFREYLDEERAIKNIPVMRMIARTAEELEKQAEEVLEKLKVYNGGTSMIEAGNINFYLQTEPSISMVGGGSLPGETMESWAVTMEPEGISCDVLSKKMRELEVPVIAYTKNDKLWLDMRTILPEEVELLVKSLEMVMK